MSWVIVAALVRLFTSQKSVIVCAQANIWPTFNAERGKENEGQLWIALTRNNNRWSRIDRDRSAAFRKTKQASAPPVRTSCGAKRVNDFESHRRSYHMTAGGGGGGSSFLPSFSLLHACYTSHGIDPLRSHNDSSPQVSSERRYYKSLHS